MADPFGVWYDTYIEEDYEWYIGLEGDNRKYIDGVAEDAWQAGYEQGRADAHKDVVTNITHTFFDPTV